MFWFFGCKTCRITVPQPGMEWGVRIHLPAQEVGLTSGLRRPHVPRSNCAHAPQLLSPRSRAREPRLRSPDTLEPAHCSAWSLCPATADATAMGNPCATARGAPARHSQAPRGAAKTSAAKNKNK